MLEREAKWVGQQLDAVPVEALSPLLSVGSGTAAGRARQPWIDELVFLPLARRGIDVVHHEFADGPGVQISGDLDDPAVRDRLASLGARSILCLNVLEHLRDPAPLARTLAKALPAGGRLIVTVPRRYPYHPDPIDTMFRPTVDDVASLFPTLRLLAGEEILCGTLVRYALSVRGKREMVANGLRSLKQRRPESRSTGKSGGLRAVLPYLVRQTVVTGVMFAADQ